MSAAGWVVRGWKYDQECGWSSWVILRGGVMLRPETTAFAAEVMALIRGTTVLRQLAVPRHCNH
eukprot:9736195-Karenia_brevis.AAC.1